MAKKLLVDHIWIGYNLIMSKNHDLVLSSKNHDLV